MDDRFPMMEGYEGLRQVITVTQPPLEMVVDVKNAVELARLANDEMAELIMKYPDRFIAAVACLPMNDIDATLREADRAIRDLKFKGVQIYTPTNGKPIDGPEFMELYDMMSKHDLPIWIHPTRESSFPDYIGEDYSKYNLFMIIGWPYETTVGMARLVFSGVFDKYPNIKFITHHCGAMVPFFARRMCGLASQQLSKPSDDDFKMFYVDTAIQGSIPIILCSYAFYGDEHILFGTDMPYGGDEMHSNTIKSIETIDIPETSRKKIFSENAKKLLHL